VRFPGAIYLVIFSRGKAEEALDWTRVVVTRLGLTLNEAKTSIKEARKESFNFLGYSFGPHRFPEGWPLVSGRQSVAEERGTHQAESGRPAGARQCGTWPEARDWLNQTYETGRHISATEPA